MAGRQTVEYHGLQLRVSPDFWLRRWTRWPFFLESHNPSFRIDVRQIGEVNPQDFPNRALLFLTRFSDNTSARYEFPIADLDPTGRTRFIIPEVFTAHPGQTQIAMEGSGNWHTVYSYNVGREESLWLALLALPVGAVGSGVTFALQRLF